MAVLWPRERIRRQKCCVSGEQVQKEPRAPSPIPTPASLQILPLISPKATLGVCSSPHRQRHMRITVFGPKSETSSEGSSWALLGEELGL